MEYLFVSKDSKTGLYGFVDKNGELIIPYQYYSAEDFYDGLALVMTKKLEEKRAKFDCFYIDTKGNMVISDKVTREFEEVNSFSEGRALVQGKNRKFGFIDLTGRIVIPCKYDSAFNFLEGLACVTCDKTYGFIDNNGNLVIPYSYFDAYDFSEGLAAVQDKETHLWGYIDTKGKIVIPYQYSTAFSFYGSFALVYDKGYGYINKKGEKIFPSMYGRKAKCFEGFAAQDDNGYFASTGGIVSNVVYVIDEINLSIEGFLTYDYRVEKDRRYTFGDLSGNIFTAQTECELEMKILDFLKSTLMKKPKKEKIPVKVRKG